LKIEFLIRNVRGVFEAGFLASLDASVRVDLEMGLA
jgi:hypothetical protein